MNPFRTSGRRSAPLILLVAGALLGLTLSLGLGTSPVAAGDPGHRHPTPQSAAQSRSDFHDGMRKLWEDHVTWTRLAIVTFADGSGGFGPTAGRLLQNQIDIGDAIKPYYGDAAGDRLTALLHDHITIAVELLQAAKAADAMRAAMRTHLDQTLTEASDELQGHYAASITDFEAIHAHILMMADQLSAGIIQAFPARFH